MIKYQFSFEIKALAHKQIVNTGWILTIQKQYVSVGIIFQRMIQDLQIHKWNFIEDDQIKKLAFDFGNYIIPVAMQIWQQAK